LEPLFESGRNKNGGRGNLIPRPPSSSPDQCRHGSIDRRLILRSCTASTVECDSSRRCSRC
jgi:hypothetical protein